MTVYERLARLQSVRPSPATAQYLDLLQSHQELAERFAAFIVETRTGRVQSTSISAAAGGVVGVLDSIDAALTEMERLAADSLPAVAGQH